MADVLFHGAAPHPCLTCGACCAAFRVSFYWGESTDGHGPVPAELTEQISPFLLAMTGTHRKPPRCVALEGAVGQVVRCGIYDNRPSTCRAFGASWEDGTHNPGCDEARARHGLAALRPEDWLGRPKRAA